MNIAEGEKPYAYGFEGEVLKRLEALRARIRTGQVSEETPESKRLEFARWLHKEGEIGEGIEEGKPPLTIEAVIKAHEVVATSGSTVKVEQRPLLHEGLDEETSNSGIYGE